MRDGHETVVNQFLSAGADINMQSQMGQTALHEALYGGWFPIIRALLSAGANPLLLDGYGRTCMDWASLHQPTFTAMLPYCDHYCPTNEAITTQALHESIVTIANKLRQSPLNSSYHELGHCLLLSNDYEKASTAFEQQIVKAPTKPRPVHLAMCSSCASTMSGDRFVCCTCADIDLCSSCMEKYNTEGSIRTCKGHKFLKVPGNDWEWLTDLHVNKLGESKDQWLERLAKKYQT
jgi:Ankyrin repeats (3 copies)